MGGEYTTANVTLVEDRKFKNSDFLATGRGSLADRFADRVQLVERKTGLCVVPKMGKVKR